MFLNLSAQRGVAYLSSGSEVFAVIMPFVSSSKPCYYSNEFHYITGIETRNLYLSIAFKDFLK